VIEAKNKDLKVTASLVCQSSWARYSSAVGVVVSWAGSGHLF